MLRGRALELSGRGRRATGFVRLAVWGWRGVTVRGGLGHSAQTARNQRPHPLQTGETGGYDLYVVGAL